MSRMSHAVRMGVLAAIGLGCAQAAWAQDDQAQVWAASCGSCHGTNGRSAGDVPSLAGRSKADLLVLLQEFRAGKRKAATIMHQYAVAYSDQELERMADFFSRQPR